MRFSMRSACVALVTISLVYLCYTYFWGPLEGHNNNNGNTKSKVLKQSYYRKPDSGSQLLLHPPHHHGLLKKIGSGRGDVKKVKLKLLLRKSKIWRKKDLRAENKKHEVGGGYG